MLVNLTYQKEIYFSVYKTIPSTAEIPIPKIRLRAGSHSGMLYVTGILRGTAK